MNVRWLVATVCVIGLMACEVPQWTGVERGQAEPGDGAAQRESGADDPGGAEVSGPGELGDASFEDVEFDGPVVISEGGRYTGDWQSLDPDTPAVVIDTQEPVTIENARLRSRGPIIESDLAGTDVTVRNSVARGLDPEQNGVEVGRFVSLSEARRVIIDNNEIVQTAGIVLRGYGGDGSDDQTFKIRRNVMRNIDGRVSNGSGLSNDDSTTEYAQFVQFVEAHDVPNVEVAWNEVRNEPGNSRVEDVVSVFRSSGTPDSPITIRDNFIDGAYPTDPETDDYSGGGILLGDGLPSGRGAANVEAFRNHVLNTSNYGIAISAGSNATIRDNRVFSSGRLEDGSPVAAQNVGIYVWNLHDQAGFSNNDVINNLVGWENAAENSRGDYWLPDVSNASGNEAYDGTVTADVLDDEYARWKQRTEQEQVLIGVSD